jgi:hypothetical protein
MVGNNIETGKAPPGYKDQVCLRNKNRDDVILISEEPIVQSKTHDLVTCRFNWSKVPDYRTSLNILGISN